MAKLQGSVIALRNGTEKPDLFFVTLAVNNRHTVTYIGWEVNESWQIKC